MKKFYSLVTAILTIAFISQAQDTWTQKANFGGVARSLDVGFAIGNKGYVGTGESNDGSSYFLYNDFWEYDQGTNVWTQKANFQGGVRAYAVGFSIGSKGYVGAGQDLSTSYKDFWEYDPITNIWAKKSDFGGGNRSAAVGFSIGSKGYVGTGSNAGNTKNDFWEYDPAVNTWTQKSTFPGAARDRGVGFSIGTRGYIGLGWKSVFGTYLNDFYEYDQGTNSWTQKSAFPGPGREGAVGISTSDRGYVGLGAEDNIAYYSDWWEFQPSLNAWIQKSNFTGSVRHLAAGFSINDKCYVGTGECCTIDGQLKDFWEYSTCDSGLTVYADADDDGYGNPSISTTNPPCDLLNGYVLNNTDCNDANANIHPGAVELDNCIDDNCNGVIDDGMWLQKANFKGVARHDAVGFVINGKVYLGTGDDNNGQYQKDLWEYDPATNVWKQKADFKGDGRFKAAAFSIGTKGYIGTGVNNNGTLLNDFWEYDVAANSWTQKADFGGSPRQRAVGFSIGTYGYIGTGADFLTQKNDFWQYDPLSNSWTQKANVGDSLRGGAAGFSIGTKGYIGTGYSKSGGYKNDFWEYDPLSDSWTRKADFPGSARSGAVGFSIDSNGYIATGFDGTTYYTNGYEYIPAIDTWKQIVDLVGNARAYAVAGSVSGKAYISTGSITGSAFKDVWEYAPPATVQVFAYRDADGDGYGNAATSVPVSYCNIPGGYVLDSTDCNDSNPSIHPGAKEICNGIDDNCDGLIDPTTNYYADVDGDGYGNVHSRIDSCARPVGYVADTTDCNDQDANVHPGATEICNNIDDNCNGQVDEGVQSTFYADADGDGYGTPKSSVIACSQPAGYVIDSTDCDDTNPNVNPGEKEIPNNGIDDNCNGLIDEFGTGVSSITNSASTLSVFPNPTNGTFIIELKLSNQVSEQTTVEVINVLGQTVLSQKAEINKGKLQQEINLANVMSGVYLVKVIVNDKVYTKQISLEK